uniref:Ribosomal protein L39 n=1 Tax=Cannabis sativa TaxID=3483 RepID=A0A803QB42_CANSA
MPSHKSFMIKKKLAKKMRQNRPIPHWIRLRTDNTIRVAAVWKHTHFRVSIPHVENLNGHDIYAYLVEAHKDSDLEKILCLMWSIWTERNKEIHGTRPKPAPNILIFVDSYVDQFRKAKHCATNQKDQAVCTSSTTSAATSSLTSNSATPLKWLPPLQVSTLLMWMMRIMRKLQLLVLERYLEIMQEM